MKYYLAPLEGITGYTYRNAYHNCFTDFDKYFLPFIAPHDNRSFNAKEKNDLMPEHNQGMHVVPQVLTKSAKDFKRIANDLRAFGYSEINLNLGCPSGTVVAKGRGSGFLAYPEELNAFLDEVFSKADIKISLKTRVGKDSYEEWEELLEIYNQYPVEELIVHPRIQKDFYKSKPNMATFAWAAEHSTNKICYNGDLFTLEDYTEFTKAYPNIELTMFGRGVLKNPGLLGELKGQERIDKERLLAFHDRIYQDYTNLFSGDRNVLFKMKEIWSYQIQLFADAEKYAKKIHKVQHAADYEAIVRELFANVPLR
jgi:tRNA-dihydrouridine synthase